MQGRPGGAVAAAAAPACATSESTWRSTLKRLWPARCFTMLALSCIASALPRLGAYVSGAASSVKHSASAGAGLAWSAGAGPLASASTDRKARLQVSTHHHQACRQVCQQGHVCNRARTRDKNNNSLGIFSKQAIWTYGHRQLKLKRRVRTCAGAAPGGMPAPSHAAAPAPGPGAQALRTAATAWQVLQARMHACVPWVQWCMTACTNSRNLIATQRRTRAEHALFRHHYTFRGVGPAWCYKPNQPHTHAPGALAPRTMMRASAASSVTCSSRRQSRKNSNRVTCSGSATNDALHPA